MKLKATIVVVRDCPTWEDCAEFNKLVGEKAQEIGANPQDVTVVATRNRKEKVNG